MPGWALVDTHSSLGRTFRRPLDVLELAFLWDGLLNGTADNVQHIELRLKNGRRDEHLFSDTNIVRAWLSTKRRYPLAGATVRGADSAPLRVKIATGSKADSGTRLASEPHFFIREHDLSVLRPCEVVFGQVTCAEDANQQVAAILHGPRPLSEELLVQLYVLRETDSERTNILHLMILTAHCVTDGMANSTLMRCLLDTLARGEGKPAQISLEERLAMAVPLVDLKPRHLHSFSPAIRRWRRAVGMVIFQLRMEKLQGGHTLPCRLTRSTPHVPARSGLVSISLPPTQTAAVISNCRLHGLKFGNAYFALAQVAMTRVLYRRYLRGEISEEEWDYRKRQPHISGGPFNLRPYLDNAWFEKGGGGEFVSSIGFFFHQLPSMTLGKTTERHRSMLSDDAPSFSDLLTFDRFLYRAGLIEKQARAFFGHPLLLEILHAGMTRFERGRFDVLQWAQHNEIPAEHNTQGNPDEDMVLAVTDIPLVWAHGGSSIGNMDLIYPREYPLSHTHPLSPYSIVPHPARTGYVTPPSRLPSTSAADTMPKIVVENWRTHLHARPAELYLGASSLRGRLSMHVFYDGNVFEEAVVREWLDEVREAVLWYLGRTHPSRPTRRQSCGGAVRPVRDGEAVRTKL